MIRPELEEAYALPKGSFRFEKALRGKEMSFICEVKKASPYKGIISEEFPYLEIAKSYEKSGADCISVLTEPKWFLGSDEIFCQIRQEVSLPMIRKDFTVDEYQIYEAKVMGADAVLLICALLDTDTIRKYLEIVKTMEQAGADLIELGIPFSDPTAEGPVIQKANLRALQGGVTTDKIFEMVKELRKTVQIPMVFMTYANVVFSYGTERFLQKAKECGMDGIILPDVPYEEKADFAPACKKYGLDFISLIAPTSHERIEQIAKEAEGFVYCVSSLWVLPLSSWWKNMEKIVFHILRNL